jgi:lipoate-protein ligase A
MMIMLHHTQLTGAFLLRRVTRVFKVYKENREYKVFRVFREYRVSKVILAPVFLSAALWVKYL